MHPQSSRVSTSGGILSYTNRPCPTGWEQALPRLGPHSSAGTPPPPPRPPPFPSGSSSFGILGAPASRARRSSGSPSGLAVHLPLDPPRPSPGPAPRPRPGAGRPLCRRGPSFRAGTRLASLPHGTAGTGAAEPDSSCLLFRVDGETLPGGPAGWSRWVKGCVGPPFPGTLRLSLPWGRLPGAQRLGRGRPFQEESVPTGFCLQPGVGPVALWGRERTARSPRKPRQGPVGTHFSAHGLRLGALSPLVALGTRRSLCWKEGWV